MTILNECCRNQIIYYLLFVKKLLEEKGLDYTLEKIGESIKYLTPLEK